MNIRFKTVNVLHTLFYLAISRKEKEVNVITGIIFIAGGEQSRKFMALNFLRQ
jgi:hypothetical protein